MRESKHLRRVADNTTLSARETQVVAGIASGRLNKEIAFELGISECTVKNHCSTIYRKLGVYNRAGAVAHYLGYGKGGNDATRD